MKQLSSFLVLNINGGDRIAFTYDEIDGKTGEVIAQNTKESFFVVDESIRKKINDIRNYIRDNKLS